MPLSVSAFQNRSRGKIGKSVCAAVTPPDFVPATSTFGSRVEPWSCLPRIESSGRFSGSLLACKREHFLSDFMFCQSCNCRKMCFQDEPSQSPAATAPPRGGALGRTSKSCPHSSTAGRSLPLSYKLYAFAKASPFRERWHGEAVTERVASGAKPGRRGCPPTAKKPACPLPFYGADKLAFVFLFRGRAYSSILPKPRPSKSSTRSVRLGATGSALAASRGA